MKLHCFTWGDQKSPAIVLLHGLGGTGKIWRPLASGLEKKLFVIAPDQRSHGQSQAGESHTPLDYGKDIADTLDDLGIEKAWILGHSMGARTAIGFASLHPEKVEGLVCVDIGFGGDAGGSVGPRLRPIIETLPLEFQFREEARQWLESKMPDPSITQYLLAVSLPHPKYPKGLVFPFHREGVLDTIDSSINLNVRPWLESYAEHGNPGMILRGGNSLVLKKEAFDAEMKHFSHFENLTFETWPDTGHGLPFEKRKELTEAIFNWMEAN